MSDQEILEKAISKAIDGGWTPEIYSEKDKIFFDIDKSSNPKYVRWFMREDMEGVSHIQNTEAIIFNHDFAKALWGDDWKNVIKWKYHLQQMVIADDPIKYLGEHI